MLQQLVLHVHHLVLLFRIVSNGEAVDHEEMVISPVTVADEHLQPAGQSGAVCDELGKGRN